MKVMDYEKEYNSWKWDIPEYYNIGYDVVDKHVDNPAIKNKVALYWENEEGRREKYTFWEYSLLSNKFGNVLRDLGIKKGDRFLMVLPNVPEFQQIFLGGVKIGAVPIPASVMFKAKELEYRVNDSESKLVVVHSKYAEEVRKIKESCPSLKNVIIVGEGGTEKGEVHFNDLMREASTKLELEKTRSDDMAFFCYTSGTTGMPKGAVHMHRWVLANDPNSKYWAAYKEDDIYAHTGSLNWIYPLGNGFLYAWRWGISTFLYDGRFNPEKWFELMERYQVTNLASVPTAYRMFLAVEEAEKRFDLKLRHCISAGEPLNPEVVKEWKKRFGVDILDGIGMTEVMVYLSNMEGMPIKPGSCGRPQPGHVCAILDDDGNPLGPYQEGTLAVRADDPGLLKEYWRKPEKTAECYKNGWFLTGDTLYMDEDGYYWFSGRGDDLIMTAGYRVSPFEVESVVNEHPAVLESAAVASPDPVRGVIVKSFIILNEGYEPSQELAKEIQQFVKERTAPYKYPREIEFVKELPKTQSGKIKRKVLRELEKERKVGKKS
ncbi:MAG: acyl-CoA synthetase [Thermoplasmata archaeon]|nr:acyl-CoA synthetase [Thermoplasmata archaeon]